MRKVQGTYSYFLVLLLLALCYLICSMFYVYQRAKCREEKAKKLQSLCHEIDRQNKN